MRRWWQIAVAADFQDVLTPREMEVLILRQNGMKQRDIAEYLGISQNTARIHMQHARVKVERAHQVSR